MEILDRSAENKANEYKWVVATVDGTTVNTAPNVGGGVINKGDFIEITTNQEFVLTASQPVLLMQYVISENTTDVNGVPTTAPGTGDPAMMLVVPVEQFQTDYIFLTPDKYAFDFVTIMADAIANIRLDGKPLPDHCTTSPADGLERGLGDPEPARVIHRCQLSFPKVTSGTNSRVLAGDQDDGVHTIVADREVGVIVYGFDRFVSYAYAGGLNLETIN